jgi:DNA-binding NtrC family response regulator
MKYPILLIDDEKEMLESMQKLLSRRTDIEITAESNARKAAAHIRAGKFALVITDLRMDELSGMDILALAREQRPAPAVILISGYGTVETGVEAMRHGAFDFLEKPFTSVKLHESIDRALQRSNEQAFTPADDLSDLAIELGVIYASKAMESILGLVRKIATGNMNILITGESGTGKEVIARGIHTLSKRQTAPFVPVNCGALPEQLFESELFGHEKGAFTGAIKRKPGLIEFADKGSFFLDEIGDMSLPMQVKLLRMLEQRTIRRVGGADEIAVDVRIIAATNKDINEEVDSGNFREDLFYRINTIHIHIPPLRERTTDILPLAKHFLKELDSKNMMGISSFTPEAERLLQNYAWPGNIRELQNVISRSYFLANDSVISDADLPLEKKQSKCAIDDEVLDLNYRDAKERIIEQFEVAYLTHQLRLHNGNISKTAESCGLDRRSIHRLVKKFNIIFAE